VESVTSLLLGCALSGVFRWLSLPTRASFASYWSYAKPLALISPMNIVVENADRVMLGSRFIPAELGLYNVSINLFEAMKSLPSAVITALFPRLTSDYNREGVESAAARFYVAQRKLLILASPIAIIGAVWATTAVTLLYGAAFARAGVMLTAFFALFWFICLASPYHYVLYASEKHRAFVWISPLSNALYGVGLWLLCRPALGLGGLGAALAFAIPHLVAFPAVLANTRRHSRITLPASTALHAALIAVLLAAGMAVQFHAPGLMSKIAATAGLLGVYAAVMAASGLLTTEDFRYAAHVVHPFRYLQHVRDELRTGGQ
jgi:O-antigen/teichoic acid export membrane protein